MISQNKLKPLTFALYISVIALVLSVVEMVGNSLDIYAFELPVVCVGFTWVLIHIAVTHRKHYWYDYVIVSVLLLTWLASYVQVARYYFRYTGPFESWDAKYVFPCNIKIWHFTQIEESTTYDPTNVTSSTFDTVCLNFVISLVLFAGTLAAKICVVAKSKK